MAQTAAAIIDEITGGPEPELELTKTEPESAPAVLPEKPTEPTEIRKPPEGFVPHAALHESRMETRELRDKVTKMEALWTDFQRRSAAPKAEAPTYDEDPLAFTKSALDRANERLAALEGKTGEREKQDSAQRTEQQLLDQYTGFIREFSKTTPEFNKAYAFLANSLDEDLKARGYDDPQDRKKAIEYEEGLMVGRAMAAKKNPAELVWNYAKARGYKTGTEENKLERLTKGQEAAKSLGGAKASGEAELTLEALSKLADEDPKAFDREWAKARKRGLLG